MYNFFALISRMKYINRWGLMRNTRIENLSEHCLDTAMIAHALGTISNIRLGGSVDTEKLAVLAMYHDSSEIITGDLPTPVKYHSDDIQKAYKEVEKLAVQSLCSKLPEDLRAIYTEILDFEDDEVYRKFVKAADKISALIKCAEERKSGNSEFINAEESTRKSLENMKMPEVDIFLEEFFPAYLLTLDEMS